MNWEVGIGPGAYYHSEWGAAVPCRELGSVTPGAGWRRVQEGADVCACM